MVAITETYKGYRQIEFRISGTAEEVSVAVTEYVNRYWPGGYDTITSTPYIDKDGTVTVSGSRLTHCD